MGVAAAKQHGVRLGPVHAFHSVAAASSVCTCRFRKLPEEQQEQLLRKLNQQQEGEDA
jgi:hypothetical protein